MKANIFTLILCVVLASCNDTKKPTSTEPEIVKTETMSFDNSLQPHKKNWELSNTS
ncbi:hypothetical protein [uncultured Winogradskyella sp.]|uniref:hypothetical protein n=1 Tax=uncultured Winogradskyella sp. TaxID=395353 RepID=UPI0030EF9B55